MTTNMPIQAGIESVAFNFDALLEKFNREIRRLQLAQTNNDVVAAFDHALNGASTAFHLLRWEAAKINPAGPIGTEAEILALKNNEDMNLLHDIVTCMKHMTVSRSKSSEEEKVVCITPANIHTYRIDDDGNDVWGRARKVIVKFGSHRAEVLLNRVYDHFKGQTSSSGIFTRYLEA